MPCIVCSYCLYVGQGETEQDKIDNVIEHENDCPANPDNEVKEEWEPPFDKDNI